MAHLWLGQTGISGWRPSGPVEWFCNDVASRFLLLDAELATVPVVPGTDAVAWAARLGDFAAERNISASMVAYRIYRQGLIDEALWLELSHHLRSQWRMARDRRREKMRERPGGPSYYRTMQHRLGSSLVASTGRLVASGALTTTKAGRVLGVRPEHVHTLVAGP